MLKNNLTPLLKYPGGKESELKYILACLPPKIQSYYEPFVGGGAVFFSITANNYYINDKSQELMLLYEMINNQDSIFFKKLKEIDHNWTLIGDIIYKYKEDLLRIYTDFLSTDSLDELKSQVLYFILTNNEEFNGLLKKEFNYDIHNFINILSKSMINKIIRMKKISLKKKELGIIDIMKNIESSIKAAFYTHLRYLYNNTEKYLLSKGEIAAIYFFIRQTCYSSMFRYNKNGEFNVPYGGLSYNKKNFKKNIDYFRSSRLLEHLNRSTIDNTDFYAFLKKHIINKDDFIFLDPPYDTDFSSYSNNEFSRQDHKRLADYLISECKANFMLVIKNSEFINNLYKQNTRTYNGGCIYITSFDKKYFVSFQNRNNKKTEHLIITNYIYN